MKTEVKEFLWALFGRIKRDTHGVAKGLRDKLKKITEQLKS